MGMVGAGPDGNTSKLAVGPSSPKMDLGALKALDDLRLGRTEVFGGAVGSGEAGLVNWMACCAEAEKPSASKVAQPDPRAAK